MTNIETILDTPFSTAFEQTDNYVLDIRPCWALMIKGTKVGFFLRTPKIPGSIYNKIVSLFRKVAQIYNVECLARVFYDINEHKYNLVIPHQSASIASVKPVHQEYDDWLLTHIPVLEVHSHGIEFDAFFSSIDDADELKRHNLYGVFSFNKGINDKEKALFRVCYGDDTKYAFIRKEDLFEDIPFSYESAFVSNILKQGKIIH